MIKLNGAAQREFLFQADASTTLQFFGELKRAVSLLPHIDLVEDYGHNELRVCYSSLELGAYTIRVITDLVCIVDEENMTSAVKPLQGREPVKGQASLNETEGYGYFASTAFLEDTEDGTFIDYRVKIAANLPRPRGLRMMPGRVVNRIATSNEIIDGFMTNAVAAFPVWLEERELAS